MFERFTDQARQAMLAAQRHAQRLQHAYIGTEHLLLGLLDVADSGAGKAMAALDISPDVVRQHIELAVGTGIRPSPRQMLFTPRAKAVLELSARESRQLGHAHIGAEHLLLGLILEGHGVAVQVLTTLGVDLALLRRQVTQYMSGYRGSEPRPTARAG